MQKKKPNWVESCSYSVLITDGIAFNRTIGIAQHTQKPLSYPAHKSGEWNILRRVWREKNQTEEERHSEPLQ